MIKKLFVSIDDTDDIGTKGTGDIAQDIINQIVESNLGTCSRITRHQLFVHEDIPYTSHNSSMCFEVNGKALDMQEIKRVAEIVIDRESAEASDPGLCILKFDEEEDYSKLITYGIAAKIEVLNKEGAYVLADEFDLFLNEYGGTGDGIIGALAGVGLRLSGGDGRHKGRINIPIGKYNVKELMQHEFIDRVKTVAGSTLNDDEYVHIGDKVKTVFLNHNSVLLVENIDGVFINAKKQTLRSY
jgi:hypothetical protein